MVKIDRFRVVTGRKQPQSAVPPGSRWPTYRSAGGPVPVRAVLFREDATVDDLIDVIEGNRKYMKCVYVYNKIDVIGIDDVDRLARQPNSLNLDRLLATMWEEMGLVRVYSKPQGQQPDFTDPFVLSTVGLKQFRLS
ncbi:hypothetical protein GW17_00015930 [Ensete ventricosum]|nr:hypothetical protein GW17_00015930 [Ensete ventricosum]